MKNTLKLFAVVTLGALLFTSCQKEKLEGQYMPKKKLSTVRTASITQIGDVETESLVLVATYNWDGKLLHDITTISELSGEGFSKETFTYDSEKRVSEVTSQTDYLTTYKFFYNNKDLSKVEVTIGNDIADEYLFTKIDGKVTEITHTPLRGAGKKGNYSSLNHFFPVQIVNAMETAANNTEKGESSVTRLTWEGNNIVKTEMEATITTLTTEYTYDDKTNPIYGLFGQGFYSTPEAIFSTNNILTVTTEMPVIGALVTTHTYEYDGDYPAKETIETKGGIINSKNTVVYTYK